MLADFFLCLQRGQNLGKTWSCYLHTLIVSGHLNKPHATRLHQRARTHSLKDGKTTSRPTAWKLKTRHYSPTCVMICHVNLQIPIQPPYSLATARSGKKSEATIPARVQTAQLLSLRHQAILEAHGRPQLPQANYRFHQNEVVIMTRTKIQTETGEGRGKKRAPLP